MTMEAAREMALKRWKGVSKKKKLATGKMLTEARQKMTPAQRSAIAKKAAAARWGKKKEANT
jgi:hypothetical protein